MAIRQIFKKTKCKKKKKIKNSNNLIQTNIKQASLIAADKYDTLEITGNGELILARDGVMATGSGGHYALAAAKALNENTNLDAETITRQSMKIAADMCVYTNHNFTMEALTYDEKDAAQRPNDDIVYTRSGNDNQQPPRR